MAGIITLSQFNPAANLLGPRQTDDNYAELDIMTKTIEAVFDVMAQEALD